MFFILLFYDRVCLQTGRKKASVEFAHALNDHRWPPKFIQQIIDVNQC